MIHSLKHLSVNWIDGMQISEQHYTGQECFIADSLRDVASFQINRFNYGLLPVEGLTDEKDIFNIYTTATNDVQLHIKKCHAVTAAGYRIDMTEVPVNINSLSDTSKEKEQTFYVLISVNPFDRVPTGDFDPEEIPPRHLHVRPRYQVQLVSANDIGNNHISGNYLMAGKVIFHEGAIDIDASFIPPCTTVSSHPRLLAYQQQFTNATAQLQQHAMTILRKANHKNQHTIITSCVTGMCRSLLHQFSNQYFHLRNMSAELSPVYLVNSFASLAHALYVCINTMQDADKETTLNYCAEWSAVPPHALLTALSSVVEINYNHYKAGEYMETIATMLTKLKMIWEKLAALEYLGQQRENIIVSEQVITQTIKQNKGWSPFD
ncbi:type VI secretion system baseplate subunit TssK [Taibaiella soli]|uniref:Type VI secretion system baseplate subunit TssK n=1 Tax=Taibaiella soli TaxID=1649169 RepID=A0A2W2AYH6_9BACT|nr:type VI secretion system baseplate subunit TssK [Taibaiella soli]PZF72748.1 hypothetical protein DN068_12880 [Taibaiella soli]